MRVTVQPAADGYDMRGNWVTKRGGKQEPSTQKSAAVRKAREMASEGDTLVVKGTDGRVLAGYPRTYQGSNSTTSDDDAGGFGFRDPADGSLTDNDFDENKDDAESVLDDLF